MLARKLQRGDTIVEVLFAVAIFSLIVVGALSLMNQGSATTQRSLEATLAGQQIDAQAETIRFMHDSYVAVYQPGISFNLSDEDTSPAEEWYKMVQYIDDAGLTSATEYGECPNYDIAEPIRGGFFINPETAAAVTTIGRLQAPETWAQLSTDGGAVVAQGLWVEAVRSADDGSTTGFIDFHIRACWDAVGVDVPMTLGTIVRLYEPRG